MQRTPEQIELIRLQSRLTKRFHKACADYQLIQDNDHILIGLSGGKDSLALVEFLGRRSQVYVPRFKVSALHVRMKEITYEADTTYLKEFCEQWGVPFILRQTSIGELRDKDKNPCFLCSWYRRKMLFDTAQERGCNKIAFGHHKDDIVETLLMNLIYEGTFATNPPLLQMEKMPLQLIRPLCLIEEKDLVRYAQLRGYMKQNKQCPFEHDSARNSVKLLLQQLETMNPNVRDSIWGAMTNIKKNYLPSQR